MVFVVLIFSKCVLCQSQHRNTFPCIILSYPTSPLPSPSTLPLNALPWYGVDQVLIPFPGLSKASALPASLQEALPTLEERSAWPNCAVWDLRVKRGWRSYPGVFLDAAKLAWASSSTQRTAEKSQVGKVSDLRPSGNEKCWLHQPLESWAGPWGTHRVQNKKVCVEWGGLEEAISPEWLYLGLLFPNFCLCCAASTFLWFELHSLLPSQPYYPKPNGPKALQTCNGWGNYRIFT